MNHPNPSTIERTQIPNSSNIRSIGYDEETQTLIIQFSSGGLYAYEVPKTVHESLMSAESPGAYFHKHIRSTYGGIKIEPKQPA